MHHRYWTVARLLKKAVQQGRSKGRPETYPLGYVEDLNDARTPVAFFQQPAKRFFDTDASAPPTHQQSQGTHCRDCRYR